MCHIHDLNDDELEMIFKKLSRRERLKCKKVCKKWYEYLVESTVFCEDRTIYFKKQSTIAEMVSTLAVAKSSFEKLVIVNLKETKDFEKLGNCLRDNGFKEVCIKSLSPKYYDLLPKLSFVESLSIESYYFPEFCKISSKNVYFRNLKKLSITIKKTLFEDMNRIIMSELPALRKMIPKEVVIHFKVLRLIGSKWLQNFNKVMKALNVNFELSKAEVDGILALKKEKLLEFCKCGLQKFIINCPERLSMKFEELLNNMENLRELRIYDIKDFSMLRELSPKNLAKITELEIRRSICKSNHDRFNFLSLLKLQIVNCQCEDCFKAILNNYMPKLRELSYEKYENSENLESVHFDFPNVIQNDLPSLRKIEVIHWTFQTLELSVEAIEKIDKLCPKLETFKLSRLDKVNISPSLEHLRDALTNGFENLKIFRVTSKEVWRSKLQLTKKYGVVRYCNFKDDLM